MSVSLLLLALLISQTPAQDAILLAGQSNAAMIRSWQLRRAAAPGVVVRRSTRIGTSIRYWLERGRAERMVRRIPARYPLRHLSFLWMQGERDAGRMTGEQYAALLRRLISRVTAEAERRWPGVEVRVVVGRISDWRSDPAWEAIREAQVRVATEDGHAWVDTDDLNLGLHCFGRYAELAQRLVLAALQPRVNA